MTNIILCGGSGTRLWPLSRKLMPKQFLKLFNDKSLFQLTIERNKKITTSQIVVSNEEQYFIALDQVEEIGESAKFLLESAAKNTAPAIALACMEFNSKDLVLVTPSDHLIKNEKEYEKVVNKAKELANENYLVTFGIKPTQANTGYGYIEADGFDVVKFHEKPELKKAKEYLEKGKASKSQWSGGKSQELFRIINSFEGDKSAFLSLFATEMQKRVKKEKR